MSETHLLPDATGEINLPPTPGLGITMNLAGMAKYIVDAEIAVKGKVLYRTPQL